MCSTVYLIISQTPGRLKCRPLRTPHLFLSLMTNLVLRGSWIFDMKTDLLHYSMCFTSLFLYLLIMLTRQIKCQSACSKEGVRIVKRIAEELSQVEKDYMLYTPTLADFESVPNVSQKLLIKILNNLNKHKKLQDKMEPCPDCELYQEEKAKTFLESLQNVLQWMNAKC